MTTLIRLTAPSFPVGYCWPTTAQQLLNDVILYGLTAQFQSDVGNSFFNFGSSTPSADNRAYPWLRTNAGVLDGWYYWNATIPAWTKPHPIEASSDYRSLWVGSTASLATWDGGDADPAGLASGPMWAVDSDFAGKFPIGPGTLAGGTVINVGDLGGADEHTITVAELPAHTHTVGANTASDIDAGGRTIHGTGTEFPDTQNTSSVGDGDAMSILPPYRGVYVIKRTSRVFYRV